MQESGKKEAAPNSLINTPASESLWYGKIPVWAGVLFIVALVGSWTAWNSYTSYKNTIEFEYKLLEVRARQREARISGSLRTVNLMMGSVIDDLRDHPTMSVAEQQELLKNYMKLLPEIRSLLITDASGRIRVHTNAKVIGFNAVDREYFKVHRDAPENDNFHIAIPFKTITGITATTQSRVMLDSRGHFAGVVAATLESTFFDEALKLRVSEAGVQSALINLNGDILNLVPDTGLIGKNLQGGIAYTEHIRSGNPTTRHLNMVKLTQVKRMSVFHNVPNSTLAVIVSRDYDIVISEWRQTMYSHVAGFLLLTTAVIFFSWLAAHRQKTLVEARQRIAERELELRTIIETEPECVKQLAADGTLLHMNRAGLNMIEAESLEQVLGQKVQQLVMPEHRDAFMALTQKVFSGESDNLVFEVQGLKGGHRWLDTHAVPLRNSEDQIIALLGITRDITERKKAELEREAALARIKKLEGIIPICMHCKKIRDDQNSWNQLEQYITNHSEAMFSHGICPQCLEVHYPQMKKQAE